VFNTQPFERTTCSLHTQSQHTTYSYLTKLAIDLQKHSESPDSYSAALRPLLHVPYRSTFTLNFFPSESLWSASHDLRNVDIIGAKGRESLVGVVSPFLFGCCCLFPEMSAAPVVDPVVFVNRLERLYSSWEVGESGSTYGWALIW